MADRTIETKIEIPVIVPTVRPTMNDVLSPTMLVETVIMPVKTQSIDPADRDAGIANSTIKMKNAICPADQPRGCSLELGDFGDS